MKNKELIVELSKQLEWNSLEVTELLDAFSSILTSSLVANDSVSLHGLGTFEVKKRGERLTVNPVSGKRFLVPPKLSPVFKPGITLKNRIKELRSS